jgi:hypothetical protein
MKSQIDHLVVAAHSLQQGVEWCEATLGITPAAGGEHEKYGTHNRLFKIATPAFPVAYFEIIAINPDAVIEKKPPPARWFDLDSKQLQAELAKSPRLLHFVVNTDNIQDARHAWKNQGIDRGPIIHASRKPPRACCNGKLRCGQTATGCSMALCQPLFNGASLKRQTPCNCILAIICPVLVCP